ncbi:NAD(P)-binding domain-containing protein [Endozoicomonas sp. ONNA1]|uniref:NAD(P)-binding domain-containing protein n=2 Tax=unclassified Endozoicomonas TaxID=2644528 RepID=UPI0021474105|nr:NAD(P)-binding domain-containing protein [Endozoicomonas sp. ONNA1]
MKCWHSAVLAMTLITSQMIHSAPFHDQLEAVRLADAHFDAQGQVETTGDIDRKVVCLRPMRKGLPEISAESVGEQVRVHLYGHGGSGWTLLWGSIEKAMALFEEKAREHKFNDQVSITIIGAGCMGKAVALSLFHAGYRNIRIVAEQDNRIASLNSTGYLAMVSLATESETEKQEAEQLAIETLKGYQSVDRGTHPIVNEGVHLIDVYSGLGKEGEEGPLETYTGIEPFAEAGLLPKPQQGVVEFSTGVSYPMQKFQTYFMDTAVIMAAFDHELRTRNIPVIHETVGSLDDIKTYVVFNCSGLGAASLNHDDKVYPNMGLLLELAHQPLKKLDYIIYTRYQPPDAPKRSSPPDKADIYFMPRSGGLLGATFVDHNDGSDNALNEALFTRILRENKQFFGYPLNTH